jgi:hypothetical protein
LSQYLNLSIACTTERDKKHPSTNEIEYDTSTTAVIEWDNKLNFPFKPADLEGATLTTNDIIKIDSVVINEAANWNIGQRKELQIDLAGRNYKRQLIAVRNSEGETEVWVNYFCTRD